MWPDCYIARRYLFLEVGLIYGYIQLTVFRSWGTVLNFFTLHFYTVFSKAPYPCIMGLPLYLNSDMIFRTSITCIFDRVQQFVQQQCLSS